MMFWSSTAAPTSVPVPAAPAHPSSVPRAHVFCTSHLHVHYSQSFLDTVRKAMQLPVGSFRVALISVEERDANDVLVSVASVIRMAKLMSTFSSLQTLYATVETAPLLLMYEVGKVECALGPRDKVVVLTDSAAVHAALAHTSAICVRGHRGNDEGGGAPIFTPDDGVGKECASQQSPPSTLQPASCSQPSSSTTSSDSPPSPSGSSAPASSVASLLEPPPFPSPSLSSCPSLPLGDDDYTDKLSARNIASSSYSSSSNDSALVPAGGDAGGAGAAGDEAVATAADADGGETRAGP